MINNRVANLFPDAGLVRYGTLKILVSIISLLLVICVAITMLKIDGSDLSSTIQQFIIAIPITGAWFLIIRLLAKQPIRHWLKHWFKHDMQFLYAVCELNEKNELHMYYVKKHRFDLFVEAKKKDKPAILILPFHNGEKSELVVFNYEYDFTTPWQIIEVKNVTTSRKEPRIAISTKSNLYDHDLFTISLNATDALKNIQSIRFGVKEFLNDAVSQRDAIITNYKTVANGTVKQIQSTSRFGQSKEAQEIRESLELATTELVGSTKKLAWPFLKRF